MLRFSLRHSGVCIQLSTEISQLEEKTRTIAEELALLNRHVEEIRDATRTAGQGEQESAGPAQDDPKGPT